MVQEDTEQTDMRDDATEQTDGERKTQLSGAVGVEAFMWYTTENGHQEQQFLRVKQERTCGSDLRSRTIGVGHIASTMLSYHRGSLLAASLPPRAPRSIRQECLLVW